MSVLTTFAQSRTIQIFFSIIFVVASMIIPQSAFASTNTNNLPLGIVEQDSCGTTSVDIYSFGAGMIQSVLPIQITNRKVTYINQGEGCAVVNWRSSITATSQVIFTEITNTSKPVEIKLSEKNFGYPMATTQNNSGTARHTAILEDLKPGKTYSYRLVTRSQPNAMPTISDPKIIVMAVPIKARVIPIVTKKVAKQVKKTPSKRVAITKKATKIRKPVKKTPIKNRVKRTKTSNGNSKILRNIGAGYTKSIYSTSTIPAAIVALNSAIGSTTTSKESSSSAANNIQNVSGFGFLLKNRIITKNNNVIITLFLLAFLFVLQQLILPAFNINLKKPLLYWLFGSVVLTVTSAIFMLYYIALVGITLFLGLLAWYLLQSVPEDEVINVNKSKFLNEKALMKKETQDVKNSLDTLKTKN